LVIALTGCVQNQQCRLRKRESPETDQAVKRSAGIVSSGLAFLDLPPMGWNPEEAPMRSEHGSGRPITILMADDDEDDRDLARDALEGTRLGQRMEFVIDGQDLIDYLRQDGRYAEAATPRPSIILLDLNMPRKDGREALAELKADKSLRQIPVVILTTSSDEVDVQKAYDLGASSYITKPVTHAQLTEVMQFVARYWSEVVELPDMPAV
jgi:CheY-like chemotaxis protein